MGIKVRLERRKRKGSVEGVIRNQDCEGEWLIASFTSIDHTSNDLGI
jgi:hypothetical protein